MSVLDRDELRYRLEEAVELLRGCLEELELTEDGRRSFAASEARGFLLNIEDEL